MGGGAVGATDGPDECNGGKLAQDVEVRGDLFIGTVVEEPAFG